MSVGNGRGADQRGMWHACKFETSDTSIGIFGVYLLPHTASTCSQRKLRFYCLASRRQLIAVIMASLSPAISTPSLQPILHGSMQPPLLLCTLLKM